MRQAVTYILDSSGNPVPEPDMKRFGEWFEHFDNRLLKRTELSKEVYVSTVFLGFDHSLSERGRPCFGKR